MAKACWRGAELLLGLALGLGLSFGHSAAATGVGSTGRADQVLDDVLATIRSRYVEPVPESDLYLGAAKGVVERLRDPYSALLRSTEYQTMRVSLHGTQALGPALLLNPALGYIALRTISSGAAADLSREIIRLRAAGMHSLVLDLRSNRGGLITEAVAVADLFLDSPAVIATVQGRNTRRDGTYRAERSQSWPDLTLIVLVDGHTASAAELIVAALQDHGRAVVVGTTSFGKGAIQTTLPVGKDHALTLTTGHWYPPSGRSVQRASRPLPHGGITPDLTAGAPGRAESDVAFMKLAEGHRTAYDNAIKEIAIHLLRTGTVVDESLVITPRMRAMLLQRLQGSGMPITTDGFSRASAIVDDDLGRALVRRSVGEETAYRWQLRRDPAVSAAVSWLEDPSRRGEDLATSLTGLRVSPVP